MPAKYPHVVKAEAYAKDVIAGKIAACKWVKLACERHFTDKEKSSRNRAYKYKFDREKAERICDFVECLPHIKGKWAGTLIVLEGWQCFILSMIFGWVHRITGRRRFRRADIMVPRKNAKSTIAAGIGLFMMVADKEYGAEVYSGATSEHQAFEVFRPAKLMVQKSPEFQANFGVLAGAKAISQLSTSSFFKPLIGNPGDGASPSCSIHDEYHEHQSDEQVDTMRTGMGAREQPLQLIITTAGDNISGPCFLEFEDGKRILNGDVENDEVFVIIYTIDDGDDWTTEIALQKANPNFGVSVEAEFLRMQQKEAIKTPRKQAVFKTKHLNLWVGALDAFFNVQKYRACKVQDLIQPRNQIPDSFSGKPCFIGLDLASKIDIAAMEILFPLGNDEYARFGRYYLPEAAVYDTPRDHYRSWAEEKWLTVTDGEIIDFERIKHDILNLSSLFGVQKIGYDPWQATQLATELMAEGAPVVEYRPSTGTMSEPMKKLDALIRAGKIRHNGDPVAAWCLSNVVAYTDAKDNVYPRKARDENKIDAAVAMIMALGLATNGKEAEKPRQYQSFFIG